MRRDRVAVAPGPVLIDGERIAASRDRATAISDRCSGVRRRPRVRRLPHAPPVRRLARARVRDEDRRRVVRGDRARRWRDPLVGAGAGEASDEEVLAQASAPRGGDAAHGTTTFECKSGYGLSVDGELRALRLAHALPVPQTTTVTALLAHAVPEGYDARAGWKRSRRCCRRWSRARRARLTSTSSRSRSATTTWPRWGSWRGRMGSICARTSSSSTRTARSRWRSTAGARSVDHLACCRRRPESTALAGPRPPPCYCRGRSSSATSGSRRHGSWPTPARSARSAPISTRAPRRSSSLPLIIGLAVRRYRWSVLEALLACTLNAAWVLRLSDRLGSLEAGKRADVLVLDGPVERIAYRFGRNPVARGDHRRRARLCSARLRGCESRGERSPTRLAGLDGIGAGSEGVGRLAWTAEDAACREWFSASGRRTRG